MIDLAPETPILHVTGPSRAGPGPPASESRGPSESPTPFTRHPGWAVEDEGVVSSPTQRRSADPAAAPGAATWPGPGALLVRQHVGGDADAKTLKDPQWLETFCASLRCS